ncbi:MAG: hypothetical protein NC177_14300 [Ruminococcus flavefaciens]|nr:hypothetical protein [Ruminococcus flavefaciens]
MRLIEPVRHSHWECVNDSENIWMCTGRNGCGFEIGLKTGSPKEHGFNYCPACGAKMDGDDENENYS